MGHARQPVLEPRDEDLDRAPDVNFTTLPVPTRRARTARLSSPLGRVGEPEDVARTALHLTSGGNPSPQAGFPTRTGTWRRRGAGPRRSDRR
ncbi:hypothetical protein SHIRM173S_10537 [Streptomyces hirsutus]